MKKIIFLFCCFVFTKVMHSQKISYGGMQQLGLIFGEQRVSTCFNFVNGIRFKKWFTGLGADIQFNRRLYNYGPIPFNTSAFYIDGRYYINKNKSFFAKTDGGVNLIIEKLPSSSRENYKKLMGYHTAFGIGFKAKLGHEVFYSFDINYLIKQTRFNYNYIGFRNEWQTEKYDVRQYAIILNMGLEFF